MSPLHNLLALAGLGLLLGLRHAFEPDHLAAVSTLATRQGRLLDACRLGLAWALGHTASVGVVVGAIVLFGLRDRKSTRLNSSHGYISYAVFCLKKKKKKKTIPSRRVSADVCELEWSGV